MWAIVTYFSVLMVMAMRTGQPEFVVPLALTAAALITWLEQLAGTDDRVGYTASHTGPGLLYDVYSDRDDPKR